MRKTIEISILIEVHDVRDFVRAAREQARKDGLSEEEAKEYSARDLTGCAVMLFDPGMSPAGCTILDSSAEVSE